MGKQKCLMAPLTYATPFWSHGKPIARGIVDLLVFIYVQIFAVVILLWYSTQKHIARARSALQVCIAHQIYPLSNPLSAGLRRIFEHRILALNFVDFSSTFVRLYF